MPVEEQMLHDYKCLIFVSSPPIYYHLQSLPAIHLLQLQLLYCKQHKTRRERLETILGGRGWNVAGRESMGM